MRWGVHRVGEDPWQIGCIPVTLAIVGNLASRTHAWRLLAVPVVLVTAGLLIVNLPAASHGGDLPIGRLRPAARLLVGEHDFRSFCRSQGSGARTIRTLRRLSVTRVGHEVQFRAEANAFLHQMVRSIVGTLVAVGEGRIDPKAMPEILAARMRSAAGPVAPPQGLALLHVTYGRS